MVDPCDGYPKYIGLLMRRPSITLCMSITLVTKDALTGGPYIIVCDLALSNWPPSDKLAPLASGKWFYCVGSLEDQWEPSVSNFKWQRDNISLCKKFFEPGHQDLCNLCMRYLVWERGMCKQLLSMYSIPVTWVDRTRPTIKTHRAMYFPAYLYYFCQLQQVICES